MAWYYHSMSQLRWSLPAHLIFTHAIASCLECNFCQPNPIYIYFIYLFFYSKMVHFLFSFLTLCLCFQYFHNDLLFNKERLADPVAITFSTHGTTICSADMFLCFRQLMRTFVSQHEPL